jgi:hypothetical protein
MRARYPWPVYAAAARWIWQAYQEGTLGVEVLQMPTGEKLLALGVGASILLEQGWVLTDVTK